MGRIDLVCLGTGKGATAVYSGHPSTAYAVMLDGYPIILLDLGIGVTRSCLHHCAGIIPEVIYISHNHLDHSAELPIVVSVESAKGKRLRVVAAPDVMRRITENRFAEYHDALAMNSKRLTDLAEFIEAPEGVSTPLVGDFSIVPLLSQHSERCYGCILYYKDAPILGFGADSGCDRGYYTRMMMAPNVLLDCRQGEGTYDHASFEEIYQCLTSMSIPASTRFFLSHYGGDIHAEGPSAKFFGNMKNVVTLRCGDVVPLLHSDAIQSPYAHYLGPNPRSSGGGVGVVDSPSQYNPHTAPFSGGRNRTSNDQTFYYVDPHSYSGGGHVSPPRENFYHQVGSPHNTPRGSRRRAVSPANYQHAQYQYKLPGQRTTDNHMISPQFQAVPTTAKKIYVFSNEDKSSPPYMVPLHQLRTLQQLKLKVSDMVPNIKPLRALYSVAGHVIQHIEELSHMQEIIAVKHAGAPFDPQELPRGLRMINQM